MILLKMSLQSYEGYKDNSQPLGLDQRFSETQKSHVERVSPSQESVMPS